jgi:hypothetical protein
MEPTRSPQQDTPDAPSPPAVPRDPLDQHPDRISAQLAAPAR